MSTNKTRHFVLVAISSLVAATIALAPISPVVAENAHKGHIEIESFSGVDIDRDSESADQSSRAEVTVENSLDLDVEKGERPTVDREHSITFGDGERGKRPPK